MASQFFSKNLLVVLFFLALAFSSYFLYAPSNSTRLAVPHFFALGLSNSVNNSCYSVYSQHESNLSHTTLVLSSVTSHDEVLAALVYTFSQLPTNLTVYALWLRFDMQSVLAEFYSGIIVSSTLVKSRLRAGPLSVIVLTTCAFEIFEIGAEIALAMDKNPSMIVWCVIHDGGNAHVQNFVDRLIPLAKYGGLKIIVLASHVEKYIRSNLFLSNRSCFEVETFVPVFKLGRLLNDSCLSESDDKIPPFCTNTLTIQGTFESARRAYDDIFQSLLRQIEADPSKWKSFVLQIFGKRVSWSKLPQSPLLRKHINPQDSLNFSQYYRMIGESAALILGFSTNIYLQTKASSSVAAAVITGVPILGQAEVLNYGYISEHVMIVQKKNESYGDSIARIIAMTPVELAQKRKAMSHLSHQLTIRNLGFARKLMRIDG